MKVYKVSFEGISLNNITKFFLKKIEAEIWYVGNQFFIVQDITFNDARLRDKIKRDYENIQDFVQSVGVVNDFACISDGIGSLDELEKLAKENVMEWIKRDAFEMFT